MAFRRAGGRELGVRLEGVREIVAHDVHDREAVLDGLHTAAAGEMGSVAVREAHDVILRNARLNRPGF